MTREINTEKFNGLAVLIPEDVSDIKFTRCRYLSYKRPKSKHQSRFHKKYRWLGYTTELSEEQCDKIVPSLDEDKRYGYERYTQHEDFGCSTAKESFATLMDLLKCYSENPLVDPEFTLSYGNGAYYYGASEEEFEEYQEAQNNTGRWLILEEIK